MIAIGHRVFMYTFFVNFSPNITGLEEPNFAIVWHPEEEALNKAGQNNVILMKNLRQLFFK